MRILLFLFLPVAMMAGESKPCVFCEIASGKHAATVVDRDDQVVAFMDRAPRNPGHVLIIPVAHAENYLEIPADTLGAMMVAAQKIGRALRRTDLKAEGLVLQMNTGEAAAQSVFHAHLHVVPRFVGDARTHTENDVVSPAELEAVAGKLRAALAEPETPLVARVRMVLPALGQEVPLEQIRVICEYYGLRDLWKKIERDPPVRPFKSDGCTGWFDEWKGVSLYAAGFFHDLKYWAGYPGEEVERLAADAELMTDVARLLKSTAMAETMFHGVRLGGAEQLKTPFSWGFGRQPVASQPAETRGPRSAPGE